MKKITISFIFIFFTILFFSGSVSASEDQFIIVNKATNKLALYENDQLYREFDVATGRTSSLTPEGMFRAIVKWECPIYYAGYNGPCDPDNPLGNRWIGLSVTGTNGYLYGIHGNNDPDSIGTYASSGCVRMYDEEVLWLFERINLNIKVLIVHSNQSFDTIAFQHGLITNSESGPIIYTVNRGDYLYKIGQMFNVAYTKIIEWNDLKSNIIYIGQQLIVSEPQETTPEPIQEPIEEPNDPPVEEPVEEPIPPETVTETYTVKSGDSLWKISNMYNISIAKLKEINNLTSNIIYVGQILKISEGTEAPVSPPPTEETEPPSEDETTIENPTTKIHVVKSGDTLWRISLTYKMTVQELKTLNNLTSNLIFPGQELIVS